MKILTIGDIHGRTCWKRIIFGTPERFDEWCLSSLTRKNDDIPYDKVIFIGDYLDTRSAITPEAILNNLKDIIRLKRNSPDKVVLLFGNHDWHYIAPNQRYSGFDYGMAVSYKDELLRNLDQFDLAYHQNINGQDFLWSHAGITNLWLNDFKISMADKLKRLGVEITDDFGSLVEALNIGLQSINYSISHCGVSSGGHHPTGSIIWTRPLALCADTIPNVVQVVGHTWNDSVGYYKMTNNSNLVMVDCLNFEDDLCSVDDCFVIDTDKWTGDCFSEYLFYI